MNFQTQPRTLMIRLDRIGDLVLTLPVDQSLTEKSNGAPLLEATSRVDWWIPEGLSFITKNSNPPRQSLEIPRKPSLSKFFQLLGVLRGQTYKIVVVFQAPWWVGLAVWWSRIPIRIGVRSRWYSYLFFNRGVRQRRSQAVFSELEYGYQLVEDGLRLKRGSLQRQSLSLSSQTPGERDKALNAFGLADKSYFIIHPGMAGSARNWPAEKYADLIVHLTQKDPKNFVAITGTHADLPWLSPLKKMLEARSDFAQGQLIWLNEKLSGSELIAVLESARAIIAPSTGVLHLAASTGRPTLGIFSPVLVQRARRWGPQGPSVKAMEPSVECPGTFNCLGEKCPQYDCMNLITVDQVVNELLSFN